MLISVFMKFGIWKANIYSSTACGAKMLSWDEGEEDEKEMSRMLRVLRDKVTAGNYFKNEAKSEVKKSDAEQQNKLNQRLTRNYIS
ncbi:hypothetical protein Q1695_010496 [Nippostrongylus brasiliensis]|nr:hypothetical protein Q1695_010496 [Nippostrongylus brasiliensis]